MTSSVPTTFKTSLQKKKKCTLRLVDGSEFIGHLLGYEGFSVGELIFNTAMSGYQEIITDPSYAKQLICFTSPHIGNVGVNFFDNESNQIAASGIIVRDVPENYHNWRSNQSLNDWLIEKKITAISNIDTRHITKIIRTQGAMKALIFSKGFKAKAIKALNQFQGLAKCDLAKEVSTKKSYSFKHTLYDLANPTVNPTLKQSYYKVAVLDFGVKTQILRILASLGCDLTVFPAQTDYKTIQSGHFDGVFLSNGPGDPEPCSYAINLIKKLLVEKIPLFGICLGHQLLGLALGAKTIKMHNGHHGANHPVQCLKTNRVMISSQNHGFCLSDPLPSEIQITHRSLFDNTIQGIEHSSLPAYGFQGHPEASPGPHDVRELFTRFIAAMKKNHSQEKCPKEQI